MNPSTAGTDQKKAAASTTLWRPEETFWQHYSPHHEFPVATVSAVTLCGVAVGILFLWWILVGFDLNSEVDRPVRVDVASTDPPGGGGGYDALGTGNASLGTKYPTELAADDVKRTSVPPRPIDPTSKLTVPEIKPEQLPAISSPEFKDASEDSKTFENIRQGLKQVDTTQKMAAEREKIRKAAQRAAVSGPGGPPGGRNSPGAGGGTGGGIGTGTGPNIGPGGGGDPFGRPATPQEIHAYRWRIYLSPDIEQHVRTLIAMRVTYVFEANGRQYKVLDLRRTPVELVAIPPINHREVVAWEQTNFGIMRALAQRLKLKFWPSKGIITLPTDVEEKLATVEREAAQRQGRPLETIRFTNFDVKLVNGVYEPYVTGFE